MIVYGDSQITTTLKQAFTDLAKFVRNAHADLDALRAVLIRCGQLEQAVEDCTEVPNGIRQVARELTDVAAQRFYSAFLGVSLNDSDLTPIAKLLCSTLSSTNLTLKTPEGFAFYSLYPEQYIHAAHRWMQEHNAQRQCHAFVIGLRSIGTTLSAVVAETLRRNGWRCCRTTVRPSGHPFQREVNLNLDVRHSPFALVVDEGPGLSGSSFSAAAEALFRAGFSPNRTAFLPGHGGEPGCQATERVREVWRIVQRYSSSSSEPLWPEGSIAESLCRRTEELFHCGVTEFTDVSGGEWRRFAYQHLSEYPPVAAAFERPKYLFQLQNGCRVLWKFSGLTGGRTTVSSGPFAMTVPLAVHRGFELFEWVEGRRLTLKDSTPALVVMLGDHIENLARPAGESYAPAIERLRHMVVNNICELIDESAMKLALETLESAEFPETLPAYGDGRLAPHEFILSHAGELVKSDLDGPGGDHTIVGTQPILWDAAGAIVEWNLTDLQAQFLLSRIRSAPENSKALPFFCIAYAAFRAGLMAFAETSAEITKGERVKTAQRFYLEAIQKVLSTDTVKSRALF